MTKLILTSDLIKRESVSCNKEQMNLKIDKKLKKEFQKWCVDRETTMSLELEAMIRNRIEN